MFKKLMGMVLCGTVMFLGLAHASTIQLPGGESSAKLLGNEDVSFGVGVQYDSMTERELDVSNAEVEMDTAVAKLSLEFQDKFSLYTTLGSTSDTLLKETDATGTVQYFLDDVLVWGVGVAGTLYSHEDSGIDVFGDVSYREATEMEVQELDLYGTRYSKSQFTTGTSIEADYEEFQIALGVSKEFDKFKPYAGIQYSDVDAVARATISGTQYDISAGADEEVGLFAGASLSAWEGFSVDVQGRFVNETAFTVAATYKF